MLTASQDPVQLVLQGFEKPATLEVWLLSCLKPGTQPVPGKVVKPGCLGCTHAVCDSCEWVQP